MTLPRALIVSLRPHQWTKNLVVLAALAFSKHLFEPDAFVRAAVAFAVFCALAGAAYLVNDVLDAEQDRQHPLKRHRPVASGALPASVARGAAGALAATALAASAWLGRDFALVALGYLLLTLLYSLVLKHHVILDVLAIAIGFVLRAVAGALAIEVRFSDWLLVCTILLALFLALAKRRHELVSLEDASGHRRILREYSPYLLDQMIAVVTASCLTAYAFYTLAPETVEKYRTDRLSWTIPFVIYGIFRYLYLVHRKDKGGSPTDVLLADRPLLAAVALWAAVVIAIVYTAPGIPVPRGALSAEKAGMSFEVKADGIDVQKLLADVHARIAERREAGLYTDEELRYIAERPLESVLTGRELRADLFDEFKARDEEWNFSFAPDTIFRSSHGLAGRVLGAARRVLRPVQKLFWNPTPMIAALSRQSDLNRFSVHLLHNLVLELSRLNLEVQELRNRNLQLAGRLEALERREKTLESMVAFRDDARDGAPGR